MALLSFRGISTPSLTAQGEQRRFSFFNIRRDIAYLESFPAAYKDLINRRYGKTLVARWWPAQRLYYMAGVTGAQFRLYHGVDHEVTPEMWNDILDVFYKALGAR